ncbi:hypothetical protein AALB16_15710 [Lachnospiraceae bacterium 62-35]
MPFFGQRNDGYLKLNKNVTLQVISPHKCKYVFIRKRALLFASLFNMWRERKQGSMTVEAAFCVSLFLFMTVLLMIPMRIMNTERKLQAALETVGEEIAQYAYIGEAVKSGGEQLGGAKKGEQGPKQAEQPEEYIQKAVEYFAGEGTKLYVVEKIKEKVDTRAIRNISAGKSEIMGDGYNIDLVLEYEVCLPFPVFRIEALKRQLRCCRRAWTGKDGGKGEGNASDEEEEMVFIGKGSVRYHRSRTCHYLFNDISYIDYAQISNARNKDGKKYRPCSVCGKGIKGGSVYVMPSGESYHSIRECRSITAYVQSVPLKSVESLGPCSYCSGGS